MPYFGPMHAMPVGRWKGTRFSDLPDDALDGLLNHYRENTADALGEAIYSRLTDEWIRRRARRPNRKRPRRSASTPPSSADDGRRAHTIPFIRKDESPPGPRPAA